MLFEVIFFILMGEGLIGCWEMRNWSSKEREWRRNVNYKLELEVLLFFLLRVGKEGLN